MARSSSLFRRLRARLGAYRWRRVAVLATVSLALSLSLIGYLYGFDNRFVGRLATAFLVWFCLLSVTFLALIPFVGWAATHWFGRGWAASAADAPARRVAAPAPSSAPVRRVPSRLP